MGGSDAFVLSIVCWKGRNRMREPKSFALVRGTVENDSFMDEVRIRLSYDAHEPQD